MSTVKQEWIDHNDHMNLAYYLMAFYEATNTLSLYLGMDREFKDRTHTVSFLAGMHFSYKREVCLNAPLNFFSRIISFDKKRVHFWHEMYHAEENYLAATCEMLSLNIDTQLRRVTDMPDELLTTLERVRKSHGRLPTPEGIGSSISIENTTA